MKVLFYARGVEQLGVGYLMSFLEKEGHEVELAFDPGLDNNLYYRLDFLKFLNRHDRLIRRAIEWKPDLVAFSAITNIFPFAIEFAGLMKSAVDVPFVFGGIHPTTLPEYVLDRPEVDYVIRGEGEHALAELATTLELGNDVRVIDNLCYREDGEFRMNPVRPLVRDLDALPFPKKYEFYRDGAFKNQINIITARGCPFKCAYCVNNFYKNVLYKESSDRAEPVRRRSALNVIEEIEYFAGRYPVEHILFCDEVFVTKKEWLFEFLDLFKDRFPDITFSISYYHRLIDDEVARRLAEAGATFAQGAIETASRELRERVLKRRESEQDVLRAMELLRKYKIGTSTSAIFGIPHETPDSRWETVELIERSNPDMINTYLMYPFPGTEIAELARKDGFLSEEGWEKVKMGVSSYHQESLLDGLDIENAATMAKLLPLYIKGPGPLKPMIRRMMKMNIPRLAHFLYVATAPLIYSGWTTNWFKNLLWMFWFNFSGKKRKG